MLWVMFPRVAVVVLCVAALTSCTKKAPVTSPKGTAPMDTVAHLVPFPLSIERRDGIFEITQATVIYFNGGGHYEASARFLSDYIGLAVGNQNLKVEKADGVPPAGSILLTSGEGIGQDGYEVSIHASGITITGGNSSGVFYGVQTLRQLLPPALEYEGLRAARRNAQPLRVPSILVRDRPRFMWRGAMLDVARHFLSVDDVKRYIDLMALHKLNRLHLHLADDQGWRIEIKSWPNLALY